MEVTPSVLVIEISALGVRLALWLALLLVVDVSAEVVVTLTLAEADPVADAEKAPLIV